MEGLETIATEVTEEAQSSQRKEKELRSSAFAKATAGEKEQRSTIKSINRKSTKQSNNYKARSREK